MSQVQPEVVVHLVHNYDWNDHHTGTLVYALKGEAEVIAKLRGSETVETVPVLGAVAFTANELEVIAEMLRAKRRELGPEPHEVQAWHDLEVKTRSMVLLEVINQP